MKPGPQYEEVPGDDLTERELAEMEYERLVGQANLAYKRTAASMPGPRPDPMGDRMREWVAKDQGRSFQAGFDSYFGGAVFSPNGGPFVAHHGPSEPVDPYASDNEIIDAELL